MESCPIDKKSSSTIVNSSTSSSFSFLNVNIGILGHVDSGKTSLVRSLSTQLSTAALDKNPQSQQRGITLDLGFSAFTLPMPDHLKEIATDDNIQFTLVDCPGHASLIKTIIGGAQIIDMILLVIDANKGIQTQTAECIVIGEITTDNMIIVLNKVDSIPEQDRRLKLDKVTNRIKKIFNTTKFKDVPIVETSAMIGGEKSIATSALNQLANGTGNNSVKSHGNNQVKHHQTGISTYGIDKLVDLIKSKVKIPDRNYSQPFYYAIDHCFSVKGHGTVLTGTVLSGTVNTSSMIEIPHLHIQRKVKSLQMFRKPVKSAKQGDRVGICVTNLDAELIERSIAAAPDSVPLLHAALCLVKKVRFFKHPCKSMSKFHISVGHNTIIATAVFFGGRELSVFNEELLNKAPQPQVDHIPSCNNETVNMIRSSNVSLQGGVGVGLKQSALNACYHRGFPNIDFCFCSSEQRNHHHPIQNNPSSSSSSSGTYTNNREQSHGGYEYQDEMLSTEGLIYGAEPLQWALLRFQHPVYCPLGSLVIGSRLDADTTGNSIGGEGGNHNAAAHQCRLAFYGPIKAALNGDDDLPRTGIYIWRTKICEVFQIQDASKSGLCTEAIIWKLATGNSSISLFLGLQLETECGKLGIIVNSFGADGKCRVKFSAGAILKVGSKLKFRYKKYIFDKTRTYLDQSGLQELRSTEIYPESNIDIGGVENNNSIHENPISQERKVNSKKLNQIPKTMETLINDKLSSNNIPNNTVTMNSAIAIKSNTSTNSSLSINTESNNNSSSSSSSNNNSNSILIIDVIK